MVEKVQDATSEHSISGTSYGPTRPSVSVGPSETRGEPSSSVSPSGREIFDATVTGVQDRVSLPHLRSDPPPSKTYRRLAHSLDEFRQQEGEQREARLKEVWQRLTEARNGKGKERTASVGPVNPTTVDGVGTKGATFTREKAEMLQDIYDDELLHKCGNGYGLTYARGSKLLIPWNDFYRYAEIKEVELWHVFHDELDLDGNGHLDAEELGLALENAGIPLSPGTLSEFMTTLTSSPHSHTINFREFRDFLLLLPRKVSTAEIYQYYETRRYLGDDGRGAARVTMEGDVSLSAEDKPPPNMASSIPVISMAPSQVTLPLLPVDHSYSQQTEEEEQGEVEVYEEEEHHGWFGGSTAVKYLLAGVSRTCTAPFDRLRIFLITRQPDPTLTVPSRPFGMKAVTGAMTRIYVENGILGFWIGNGLSVVKILPESAIKFLSYESSKRMFATYWDHVEDSRDISWFSRFMSGGIGGITSQLSIYPIETVKTQMMSNIGGQRRTLAQAVKHVYSLGGMRAYYRGLAIGLLGVFPYSAIDMSTFEALKLTYVRSTRQEEPGVLALLAFGSISGSVGATSVYPLNLVRTRLQASGSPAHPQLYTGIWDVVSRTYNQRGVRGFYIGLGPTLAKVIPAVSISYMVYEQSKRK
ncbi:mitochondrial carrier [Thelephora ganbajun]|uniref:Mitochondrial carrier n=1 Tax=Thelephora ganbajun TaxID=370292 RepID=A0ACB6ZRN7_THEGA|nr:mitochondrial carrier [Thelephora ganbajun]